MNLKVTTQPAFEPVTLQEAKDHIRFDDTTEDSEIYILIQQARQIAEKTLKMPLVTQTVTYFADDFSSQDWMDEGEIELTPNLQSITEIAYTDTDGNPQILSASEYEVGINQTIGKIRAKTSWPTTDGSLEAVQIKFEAGYGIEMDVPAAIRVAILLIVGHLFMNRESVTVGVAVTETPQSAEMILGIYRIENYR